MESAGKGAAIYKKKPSRDWLKKKTMKKRHQCTIFTLYTNSFLSAEGGVRSFDKNFHKSFDKNFVKSLLKVCIKFGKN